MKFSLSLLCFFLSSILAAQSDAPHPTFTNFKGDVYKMEIVELTNSKGVKKKSLTEKYGEFVYDYPKIGEIDIPALNIPESYTTEAKFPGVNRNTQYAMVLHSTMTITNSGCYEFSLNSDDGSILWINDRMVIDNDGGHKMRKRIDSIVCNPGDYDVKVWYFQSLEDKFGIVLDAKIVGKAEVCPDKQIASNEDVINFESLFFFDSASATLKKESSEEIENVAKLLLARKAKSITIIGYTDNQGTAQANQILSIQRAESIATALRNLITDKVSIKTQGMGELEPKYSNDTKEGRAKNRRVEILIEKE